MPKARDFAYSTGSAPSGSSKKGSVIVNRPTNGFVGTGLTWWGGPDETLGFVIAKSDPVARWNTRIGVNSNIGFKRSLLKSEQSFLDLVNNDYGQNFLLGEKAAEYLTNSSIWHSFLGSQLIIDQLFFDLDLNKSTSYSGSGTSWYDLSGSSYVSTITNGPGYDSTAKSLSFDGIDDYVFTGYDLSWNNTNSVSVELLINPATISGGNYGIIGKKYPDWEWAFYQYGSNLSLVYWNTGGGHTNDMDFSVYAFPDASRWYHVIYTWDHTTSTSKFYINGVLAGSKVSSNPSINQNRSNSVVVGGNTYVWADSYFRGGIQLVRFYHKALLESEVLLNYYKNNIVTTSLTHRWDFSNVVSYPRSGTLVRNLIGSVNGTLTNSPTYNSDSGGYLTFDGTNDYVELIGGNYAITLGDGNSPWTVNAWVKTTTTADSLGTGPILTNSSGGPVYSMMGINGGKMVYWVYPSNINSWKSFKGNITVNDGRWHLLTWVQKTGYQMDLYVDGNLDSTVSPTNAGNNNPIDRIGSSWAGYFAGSIGEVQINTRAFSLSEVNQHYESTSIRYN